MTGKIGNQPPHSLIQAVLDGDLAAVRRLVEAGADLNASDERGATPLHYAACGRPAVIQFLGRNGASPGARDAQGYSPLHVAYMRRDVECVRLLVGLGAEIHDPIPGMRSPVEEARADGNWIMLSALGVEEPLPVP